MSSPVEQIKQRLTVVDVVGSYIKLQKAGANFKAVCPFHSEKGPSFYVSPGREIWHCFGCNRGGDMFEFVKQIEGVEFVEALRILADRAGVELKFENKEERNERTRLLDIMSEAVEYYRGVLRESPEVLAYLKKRGLSDKTIEDFKIGFSPEEEKGWRHLFYRLKEKGYAPLDIEKSGLAIKKSESDFYDRFRGRIMFPLFDSAGRPVAFSARIFKDKGDGSGKYINSPQTPLYDKSALLYGFDKAKTEIRKKDSCIFVEGQMDVIMSHQAGVINAVAVSGTALTDRHLEFIKRLTSKLVMAFDNDEAGLIAAKRSIDLAFKHEMEVSAVFVPLGKDPADVVLENPDLWADAVGKAKHAIEFYLDFYGEKYKKDERVFKKEVEKNILPYLVLLSSGIERSHWVSVVAQKIGVTEEIILTELKKIYNEKINERTPNFSGGRNAACAPKNAAVPNRLNRLREWISGIYLWKKDEITVPEAIKEEIMKFIGGLNKEDSNKFSLEAELCYTGSEDLSSEMENLAKDYRREGMKEKQVLLAREISACEKKCDAEKLKKIMEELQKINKEMSQL